MSQASNAQSTVSRHSGQQNAPADVEDTASSVVLYGTTALPGMSRYADASAATIAPNTAFRMRRVQSLTETSTGMRCARSASPVGLTIAQRQAQLAGQIASSVASGVSHVAVATDATRNVAKQALTTAEQTAGSIEEIVYEHISRSQVDTSRAVDDVVHRLATQLTAAASGSVERSESCTHSMVDTLREELRAKFNEDHAAEEMLRGQAETRMTVLTANVENRHKKINELQVPDLSMLASMEKNLQNQMAVNTVNASIQVAQLTKKVEEQSCNNEAIVKLLDSLTQKID